MALKGKLTVLYSTLSGLFGDSNGPNRVRYLPNEPTQQILATTSKILTIITWNKRTFLKSWTTDVNSMQKLWYWF